MTDDLTTNARKFASASARYEGAEVSNCVHALCDEIDRLRAQIAALQAERDAMRAGREPPGMAMAITDEMTSRAIMALHHASGGDIDVTGDEMRAALAAALAAQPAEPVAWVSAADLASASVTRERGGPGDSHAWSEVRTHYHDVPLYAATQPARVPLTDERVDALCKEIDATAVENRGRLAILLARAVERAHGIGQ